MIRIRVATQGDADAIWAIMEPVIRAGTTYALPRDWTREAALAYWLGADHVTLVACDPAVVGTYVLRANQPGGGSHVANCGYMVASQATGQGVGRTMALDSFDRARARGFRAMQFNFVVSTNRGAVGLWQSLGFAEVGRLPDAFDHPQFGPVDALIMHRRL